MRTVTRALLFAGAFFVLAPSAFASSLEGGPSLPGDCETEGDCSNPSAPTKDSLPTQAVSKSASYFAYPSNGVNSQVVQGLTYYNPRADQTYIAGFGQGEGTPFTDDVFSFGGSNSLATVQSYFAPSPTASATAHQSDYLGRVAAAASISYIVTLSAFDTATADAIEALMLGGPLATVQGYFALNATGYAKAYGVAESLWGPDGDTSYSASRVCDGITGCGTSGFDFNLGFRRGTDFTDGAANDFYASIYLSAEADAGLGGLGVFPGDSSALVDPTITLSSALKNYNVTMAVGSFNPPSPTGPTDSAVPEPATWAMMLAGFGLVGAGMRRRKQRLALA